MEANDFVRIAKEFFLSKKPDEWTSFAEKRLYYAGKDLENGKIDIGQAIDKIRDEIKSYNVSRGDAESLEKKLKK
jgi:hypothetical protein